MLGEYEDLVDLDTCYFDNIGNWCCEKYIYICYDGTIENNNDNNTIENIEVDKNHNDYESFVRCILSVVFYPWHFWSEFT